MTPTLELLLRLAWLQLKRHWTWRDLIVKGYFLLCIVAGLIGGFMAADAPLSEIYGSASLEGFGLWMCVAMMLPDMVMKLIMMRDAVAMDDALRSRPVPEQGWNVFLLLRNLWSFWNWSIPLYMSPFIFFFLPLGQALVGFLMLVATTMTGGAMRTAMLKSTDGWWRAGILLTWAGMVVFAPLALLLTLWMPLWGRVAAWLLLCAAGTAMAYGYMCSLRPYDEHKHKVNRVRSLGRGSLLSMEWLALIRAKRMRNMVIMMVVVFMFNTYNYYLIDDMSSDWMRMMMFIMTVAGPALCELQWVFGIEANYFHGLWSKPVAIKHLLEQKYVFFGLLNFVMVVPLLPLLWLSDMSPWLLLAAPIYCAGFFNLLLLPTCLFSTRIEIFAGSLFTQQGANAKINLYGIMTLIPVAIPIACEYWLSSTWTAVIMATLGLLGIAASRPAIGWLAGVFERKRYERMEKFME